MIRLLSPSTTNKRQSSVFCWQHLATVDRSVATGGGVYRYISHQNQSALQIFMWLLVVFFSLTQDKFDIVPVCALHRVSFTYLHTTIYTPPPMKFLATPLTVDRAGCWQRSTCPCWSHSASSFMCGAIGDCVTQRRAGPSAWAETWSAQCCLHVAVVEIRSFEASIAGRRTTSQVRHRPAVSTPDDGEACRQYTVDWRATQRNAHQLLLPALPKEKGRRNSQGQVRIVSSYGAVKKNKSKTRRCWDSATCEPLDAAGVQNSAHFPYHSFIHSLFVY